MAEMSKVYDEAGRDLHLGLGTGSMIEGAARRGTRHTGSG